MMGSGERSSIQFEVEKNEELKVYRVKQVMNIRAQIISFTINPVKIKDLYLQMMEAEKEGYRPIEEIKR